MNFIFCNLEMQNINRYSLTKRVYEKTQAAYYIKYYLLEFHTAQWDVKGLERFSVKKQVITFIQHFPN